MDNIFCKLDFDNPILDAVLFFIIITFHQYMETIEDDKKVISYRLSSVAALLVGLIVYYVVSKYAKLNMSTQEIFTDMGNFN
jgi:hypothetical protein